MLNQKERRMDLEAQTNKKQYIFEGPDGCGKSTACLDIIKTNNHVSWLYLPAFKKPCDISEFNSLVRKELAELKVIGTNLLKDRSFIISEYVYSRVFKRRIYCKKKHIKKLCKIIKQQNISLTFCFAEKPILKVEDAHMPNKRLSKAYKKLMLLLKKWEVNFSVKDI